MALCGVSGVDAGVANQMALGMNCSGHGECSNTSGGGSGVCDCDASMFWSSSSDFLGSTGFDCPTNLLYVYILWSINILEVLIVAWRSQGIIVARFENFFEQKKQNKDYSLIKNRGLLAVLLFFSIQMPIQLAMSILKVLQPTRHIGVDPLATSLFFLGKVGFYGGCAAYQPALLQSILKGAKGVEMIVRFNTIALYVILFTAALIGIMPFFSIVFVSLEQRIMIVRVYYMIQAVNLFSNGCIAIYVAHSVSRVLNESASLVADPRSVQKTLRLKERLNDVQGTMRNQGLLQGILFWVFFSIPVLWNKHDYILPLSWIAMPIIAKKCAFAVSLDGAKNKSLIDRFRKNHVQDLNTSTHDGEDSETGKGSRKGGGSIVVIGGSTIQSSIVVGDLADTTMGHVVNQATSLLGPVTEEDNTGDYGKIEGKRAP